MCRFACASSSGSRVGEQHGSLALTAGNSDYAARMKGLELNSRVTSGGELQLTLVEVVVPEPGPDQIVVRVEAAPINPSDLGLLLGPADLATARALPTMTTFTVAPQRMAAVQSRVDQSMKVGNEGAGT